MLNKDPDSRPDCESLLRDPYLAEETEESEKDSPIDLRMPNSLYFYIFNR